MHTTDFLIIGGGIIGLSIARGLRRQYPDCTVTLIEKEAQCGLHASGRNSGVLHAGFYYTPDSLKARFTRLGNQQLSAYCMERGIPLNRCGKLVVAQTAADLPLLDELLQRGKANGVALQMVDEKTTRDIEPRARTVQRALFSPTTASVNPVQVMATMQEDARQEGVRIHMDTCYLHVTKHRVFTTNGAYQAGYVVNAAGLYADQIARDFGFSKNYRILPFKGLYLYSKEAPGALRTHIYPVPDLRYPFLGVHFTVSVDGRAKIGPSAMPAFWREQYQGLDNFNPVEMAQILALQTGLLAQPNFDFGRLALEELSKSSRKSMVSLAQKLVPDIHADHFKDWGKPGIRAQLLDLRQKKLEMDFVLEGDGQSLHILNAVSPAFTCALPFAEHVLESIAEKAGGRMFAVVDDSNRGSVRDAHAVTG